MTISGSSVHSDIESKVSEIEGKHQRAESALYKYETRIESLGQEREETLVNLALTYLPELEAQAISSTLREIKAEMQAVFSAKQERRRKVEEEMSSLEEKRQAVQEKIDDAAVRLDTLAQERDRLVRVVAGMLSKDQSYMALKADADARGETLGRNRERLEEFEAEAKQKLAAFESDRRFMYLARKGYAPSSGSGLVHRLDSWVAGMVNFVEAKRNYDYLQQMPQEMRQELERREAELAGVAKKVKAGKKRVSDREGLTAILEQGEEALAGRDGLVTKAGEMDARYQALKAERKDMDSTKDKYHQEAVSKLKAFLKGEDVASLKRRARSTPGSADDRLVDRLEGIDAEVRESKDRAKEARSERDSLAENLDDLRNVLRDFESHDYESHRSYFDSGFDIDALLVGYLMGQHSRSHITSEIRGSQHFRPQETYSSYHSSYGGSSSGGSHSSGGGFGGGGFSSGGGFGGGGHSSGRGF